jgi:hypothetical protein
MTYIIFGFAPKQREDNQDLEPNRQGLAASEIYRTESYEEVQAIARSGGLENEAGVFCPLQRIVNTSGADASEIVGVSPPQRRQGQADISLRKSEFDPIRNQEGMRPLPPQNSRPSRGEQPQTQDDIERAAQQSAEPITPKRTIHPSVPGVTKRQEN